MTTKRARKSGKKVQTLPVRKLSGKKAKRVKGGGLNFRYDDSPLKRG